MQELQLITVEHLKAMGIDLSDDDTAALLEHLNETLSERIGEEVTDSLDDEQLDEMLKIQQTGTPEELADWIAKNVKELEDIVSDEKDILLGELADDADNIIASVTNS